jgi:hypothetical protein
MPTLLKRFPGASLLFVFTSALLGDAAAFGAVSYNLLDTKRQINAEAYTVNDSVLLAMDVGPFNDSVSALEEVNDFFCNLRTWTASANQISTLGPASIVGSGTSAAATPNDPCTEQSSTGRSFMDIRFTTDEAYEFVLTGTSTNTFVQIFSPGGGGTIHFVRLATDPGGALSYSEILPPAAYVLTVDAYVNAYESEPVPAAASYDFELEFVSQTTPIVPLTTSATTTVLAVMLVAGSALARRACRKN